MLAKLTLPAPLVRGLVRAGMALHNYSYQLVGRLSRRLEPDGLHAKHRLMDYHGFFVSRVGPSDLVLDVGCGNGALTLDLARRCRAAVGVDMNPKSIAEAERRRAAAGLTNASFVVGDAADAPLERAPDCVVLSNVLEHVSARVELLRTLSARSPRLLIRVPLIDREWIALYKREWGIEHRLDPTHEIEYTEDAFRAEVAEAGLRVVSLRIRFGEIWAEAAR
ncbi:MAG: class I SAM-dependent methyltransferase [Elusimicrobia bacterium]|nr:class I SAM-dependent methyltransferase [Elusimicrobiota bacterium]